MRPVAILGVAQTKHVARRDDANYAELAFEVVQPLLERARMDHTGIDTVVTASSDFWDGRTISDMAVQDAVGAAGKSASKVSMDGVFALAYAAARVNCGAYRTCLVVAHGKASEGDPRHISTAAFDPVFERPLGLDDHAALGLEASLHMDPRQGTALSEGQLAVAAADSWSRAARNPNSHRRETRSVEQVLASPLVAPPLRADMIAPDSDGACAVLLGDEETGSRLGAHVWLEGFACAKGSHPIGQRLVGVGPILSGIAEEACRQARLGGTREVDVAEVHDASSVQTLQLPAGLELRADMAFNPSGGAMGAQPGFATGLVRVAEVYERLARGEGKVGLAHGQTGFVGQAHGVWILRRR